MTAGAWLFHCSPKRFNIVGFVHSGQPLSDWSARQHREEMKPGDRAGFWVSSGMPGYSAGVFATGTIRSMVWHGVVDPRFWMGGTPAPEDFIDIDFDRNIFHSPISIDELKRDPDFSDASVLRQSHRTSFHLSDSQWQAIERRVNKRRPTTRPRFTRNVCTLSGSSRDERPK